MKKISTKPKEERNKNIKRSIKAGSSYRDIGAKYGISGKRIFEIANAPHKKKPTKKK